MPIIVAAPDKVFEEPILTYVNVYQEPQNKPEGFNAHQLLPGANIPIYISNIAPPMKLLILLSETEFNTLTKEEPALYDIDSDTTYAQLTQNLSIVEKPLAYITYHYDSVMYKTSGYFNIIALIILSIFISAAFIYFFVKRSPKGERTNENNVFKENAV